MKKQNVNKRTKNLSLRPKPLGSNEPLRQSITTRPPVRWSAVVDKSSGILLRHGYTEFYVIEGSEEVIKVQPPVAPTIQGEREVDKVHRWTGSAWVLEDKRLNLIKDEVINDIRDRIYNEVTTRYPLHNQISLGLLYSSATRKPRNTERFPNRANYIELGLDWMDSAFYCFYEERDFIQDNFYTVREVRAYDWEPRVTKVLSLDPGITVEEAWKIKS
ncbi:MAG: hypothetical protein SVK08_00830 [Halobacteriota archaeon]|nr:hypothetical protein [Halobacteriota archaeon]